MNFYKNLYKRRSNGHTLTERLDRALETGLKSIIVLLLAMPPAALATTIWYFLFFEHHIDVGERAEIVSTAAWVPWLAVIAGIINASVLAKVLDEFKEIRYAIKSYDLESFMRLKDEDVSPLIYLLIVAFDVCIVGGFMLVHYQDALHGGFFVWTSAYVAALLLIVIRELDDPLKGIWFIKSVHDEWRNIDVKKWRAKYYIARRRECNVFFDFYVVPQDAPVELESK